MNKINIFNNIKRVFSSKLLSQSFKKSQMITSQYLFSFSRKHFCNLTRLNVDKLKLEKLDEEKDDKLKTEETKFNIDDNVKEFGPETDWEKEVLKSDIPVVVDCYAV